MSKITYTSQDLENHESIGAVIKNEKNEILIQHHTKFDFYTIPLGKVKAGQTIIQGLMQELFEELDIIILEFREITQQKLNYHREGKEVDINMHIFEITKYRGEIKNKEPHKHETQEFMTLEQIQKLRSLSDTTLAYLETLGIKREKQIKENNEIKETKTTNNNQELPLGLYQHFKGKMYEVIGVARHSETLEEFVVYKALYESPEFGKDALWIRPKKMFQETVTHLGKEVKRFKHVEK